MKAACHIDWPDVAPSAENNTRESLAWEYETQDRLVRCSGEFKGSRSRLATRLQVDVVIRLNPPFAIASGKNLHELGFYDPVRRHDDSRRHRFDPVDLVVDVDDRDIGCEESNPTHDVFLGRSLVEGRENLIVTDRERGRAIHDHPEQVCERDLGRQVLRIVCAVAGIPSDDLLSDD